MAIEKKLHRIAKTHTHQFFSLIVTPTAGHTSFEYVRGDRLPTSRTSESTCDAKKISYDYTLCQEIIQHVRAKDVSALTRYLQADFVLKSIRVVYERKVIQAYVKVHGNVVSY